MSSASVQYKTIGQLIEALSLIPADSVLNPAVSLRKILVTFFAVSDGSINQTHDSVKWDSVEFNNIDITTDSRRDECCTEKIATTGELLDNLKAFRDNNKGKEYAVTCNLRLIETPIIKLVPELVINQVPWHDTTLADAFKRNQRVTNALSKFLTDVTEADEDKLFAVVQKVIETMPDCPTDYVAYCIKKVDPKTTSYFVSSSKSDAEKYLSSMIKPKMDDVVSVTLSPAAMNLFKHPQPRVYVYDHCILEKVNAKVVELQQLVKGLNIQDPIV